jgi:hypothetical protein
MVVTMLQAVLALGIYTWCQVLFELRPLSRPYVAAASVGLIVANFRVMRSDTWSRVVASFEGLTEERRQTSLAVGWITSATVVALWLTAIGTLQKWQ